MFCNVRDLITGGTDWFFALPGDLGNDTRAIITREKGISGEKGDIHMQNRIPPGSRALLIAVILLGFIMVPAVLADVPGSLSYSIAAPAGGSVSQFNPVWQTFTPGSYPTIGSVYAFGSVHSRTPSSSIEFFESVSADGQISNFEYSFHYVGGLTP
jgi:hypothetical protein